MRDMTSREKQALDRWLTTAPEVEDEPEVDLIPDTEDDWEDKDSFDIDEDE